MNPLTFKIRGMDCAEEIALLKREIAPLVGGESYLSFDLLAGKMIVARNGASIDGTAIREAVRRTGMEAIPWAEFALEKEAAEGIWTAHGRGILCAVSLGFLSAGFVSHAIVSGLRAALGASGELPSVSIALFAVAIVAGGWFIAPKAWLAARRLRPDMNLLMSVAVIGAVSIGQWFEAATVSFLFALALLLESWSVGRARHAIGALLDLSPRKARCVCPQDGAYGKPSGVEEKPVEDVPVGATVMALPGDRIPLDGVITKGATSVNQAPITGESVPVAKAVGDEVFAGTMNNEGTFEFKVTRASADTTLARIIHMVEEAQSRRAPSEQWVEKFARYYTPAMMGLALVIAVVPPLGTGEWGRWFYEALVILVIACPCALVISTPVSIVAALATAARAGVLIKGGAFIEAPARLRVVALDKTGTLTFGRPEVQRIVPLNGHTEAELLARAAGIESLSEHPLARAIVRKAQRQGVVFDRAEAYHAIPGKGAEARLDGRRFWIGSHRFAHECGMERPDAHDHAEALEDAGHSVVFIGNDEHICGLISVADEVRPDAASALRALHDAGIERVVMLTGDNDGTARAVASATGVDEYLAELLPEDKVEAVRALTRSTGHVAMVGDGVNDAPAMATATVGIAMAAAGSDAAIETADIALMSDDLQRLAWLIRHSRRTLSTIYQNVAVALGLKAVFVVLALLGIATLWMAIAADMGASLLVIFNGLRLLNSPVNEADTANG